MATYVNEGRFVEYTPSGADVAAGDVIVLTDVIGIAPLPISDGVAGRLDTKGRWNVTKLAGEAWTQGQTIYWDAGNSRCTTTASTHNAIGVAAVAALSADTDGDVLLNDSIANV